MTTSVRHYETKPELPLTVFPSSSTALQYRRLHSGKYQSAVGHIRCLCETVGVTASQHRDDGETTNKQ
jgi:hypothetical protein